MAGLLDALRDPQFRRDYLQGLIDAGNRGVAGVVGGPVDLATMVMRPLGYNVEQPVMGSEWIGQKMQDAGLVSSARNPTAEMLASVVLPGAMVRGGALLDQAVTAGARNLAAPRTMHPQMGAIDLGAPKPAKAAAMMTREEFLGSPKIVGNRNAADLVPRAYKFLDDVEPETFKNGLTAKYSPHGAAVFDDSGRVIASYNNGDTLVVDKSHRRQGIAEELVYQWRSRYPAPAQATTRTKASQAVQEKVWERMQREANN